MTHNTLPMHALFDAQYQASRAQIDVPLALRRDRLRRLRRLIDGNSQALCDAVEADFGVRSRNLTEVADLFLLRSLISHLNKHLPRWIKPIKVATPVYLKPATAYIQRQPLGVVGVISPWNYPVQLALAPAATALAAGNRVMLKPSELTPRTARIDGESGARSLRCRRVLRDPGRRRAGRQVRRPAVRPPVLHRLHRHRAQGRCRSRRQPDADDAGARRQVALHHRQVLRPR